MTQQNLNNFASGNWIATIPGMDDVTFKLRTCPIPGFMATPVQLPSPGKIMVTDTGDRIEYEEMMLEFFIDSRFRNYRKMYNWVNESVDQGVAKRVDITVQLLDNQKNPQGVAVVFYDAFAYGLSQVDTDTNSEIPDVTTMASIKYTYFDFVDDPCEDC